MSTVAMPAVQVGPDTLITVKILFNGQNRRFKLALRDLGAQSLPQKLRTLLMIAPGQAVKFERFSDSVGSYVNLDSNNPAVYKQLYRAAKAKLKLRLRASIVPSIEPMASANIELATDTLRAANSTSSAGTESRPHTFFDTVLAKPKIDSPVFKPLGVPIQSQKGISVDDETAIHEKLMQLPLSRPTLPTLNDFCGTTFNIECNNCGRSVPDEHFHCGKCEMGDFDLCTACIGQGVTCNGDDHWLLKRTIRNGKVITSSTETLPPKPKDATPVPAPVPAPAPIPVAAPISAPQPVDEDQRTCNSCIIQLAASSFVTCRDCADYDLCFLCLEQGQHGHHPAHIFEPVDVSGPTVSRYVKHLCQQGRGLKHEAICDGCDSAIYGVRHKCLSCPDFDYCSTCVLVAPEVHRGHRFAPIYEQLGPLFGEKEVHKGIYCDGAICSGKARKTYIRGDRYKCTICHDTDFCANCEASPSSTHNKTHPLIKLRTPLQSLLVDTFDETHRDRPLNRPMEQSQSQSRHASTETLKVSSTNAATQVQTVAETAPIDPKAPVVRAAKDIALDLDAHFEAETTPDGTAFGPNHLISQSWTLRNPGPETWPEGCAIHYIGGDDMRNLNDKHPSPVSSMVLASSSNACHRPVRPGETFTFNVTLKSPNRQGRAVSYWRMKTAEGLPFGHKLWCDITVQRKEEEEKEKKEEESKPDVADNSEAEKSNDSSQMIFPTLEKESPESSVANVRQEPVLSAPSVAGEDEDLIDDLESMTLEEGETDDGFLTDEEYDILDAEDEDTGKRRH